MWFWKGTCETKIVKVPVKVIVEVPADNGSFSVPEPKPIDTPKSKPINKKLKDELDKAPTVNDSLEILKKHAVKRTYKDSLVDDVLSIKYHMEATGTIDSIAIDYTVFPKTIEIDTTIEATFKTKTKLFFGGDIITPFSKSNISPSIAPGIKILNAKQNKIWSVNVDIINKSANAGLYVSF
jgi:hypothetical protein